MKKKRGRPLDPNRAPFISRKQMAQRVQDLAADYYTQRDILNVIDAYGQAIMEAVIEGYSVPVYGIGRVSSKRVPPRQYKLYGSESDAGVSDSYRKPVMKFADSFTKMLKGKSLVTTDEYDEFINNGGDPRPVDTPRM